jgi:hypothetical protein
MPKKITALSDYIPAGQAARILSKKFGRPIRPDYIHQLKNIRSVKMNDRCRLYNRHDIEAATIRKRNT